MPSTPSVSSTSAMEKLGRKQPTRKKDERYKPYARGVNKVDNREENQQLPTLAEYGLISGVGRILKALREMGDRVRWPRPSVEGQAWRKDSKKKCEFHRDIGHNMEDCYTLRRDIRRLYEQVELSHQLPRGGKQQDKVGSTKPAAPPTCTKIINVITGGSDLSGLTYSAAKRRATETKGDKPETSCRICNSDLPVVAFDERDVHDEQEHHDRLGFAEEDYPAGRIQWRDNHSLGEIVIQSYMGGVNKQVRYLVIDGPSTYNVIRGGPLLHLVKAVPSTYHQCVKLPRHWE
ncbi:uncharacterized protein LOC141639196 [Silene latifolia]|uniref:uncharacterized protein LOC141639196 n=1 Tax=Silene latifolia TaxID=37657 RepID=UPI003D779283